MSWPPIEESDPGSRVYTGQTPDMMSAARLLRQPRNAIYYYVPDDHPGYAGKKGCCRKSRCGGSCRASCCGSCCDGRTKRTAVKIAVSVLVLLVALGLVAVIALVVFDPCVILGGPKC